MIQESRRILVRGTEIIDRDDARPLDLGSSVSMAAENPPTRREFPHDVLAAEEFGVPAPDPRLHRDPAHDVLAAEEFGVPAPDPAIGHGPVTLPADPTGISEPHDVLAAEEFALPAAPVHAGASVSGSGGRGRTLIAAGVATAFAALLLRKRHR